MWRGEFFKIGKRDFTFIREMRVDSVRGFISIFLAVKENWNKASFDGMTFIQSYFYNCIK